jgi:hypothetical protein
VTFDDGFSTATNSIVQKASIDIEHELGESGHGFDKFLKKWKIPSVLREQANRTPRAVHVWASWGFYSY